MFHFEVHRVDATICDTNSNSRAQKRHQPSSSGSHHLCNASSTRCTYRLACSWAGELLILTRRLHRLHGGRCTQSDSPGGWFLRPCPCAYPIRKRENRFEKRQKCDAARFPYPKATHTMQMLYHAMDASTSSSISPVLVPICLNASLLDLSNAVIVM